jgi:adenine-specific DNA-methyltransferase
MPKHQGRLELTWTDKDKTLLSSGEGRYDYAFVDPSDYRVSEVRLLQEVDRVKADTPADRPAELPTPTTDNLLITGDAMHALNALGKIPEYAEKYLGKVKLVYIDPPFNTGQAFANYEDNIEHSIWLTMLRDRLRQIKPLLADNGSVWVHLDDAELHRCRAVMDEELGADNFIANIVWKRRNDPRNTAPHVSTDHDSILVYAKNLRRCDFSSLPRTASMDGAYTNPDDDPRGPWRRSDMAARNEYSKGLYPVTTPSGRHIDGPPSGSYWRISEEELKRLDADGRIYWGPDGGSRPYIKRFLSEVSAGRVPSTVWAPEEVGFVRNGKEENRALLGDVFSTPKPERLLQRVLQIASKPGDIVLDCFAGSGTTAAVAHKMGRRWVTSELLPDTADRFTKPRLVKVVEGGDPGGVTTTTERVVVDGVELPEGMSAAEAQEFTRLLNKVAKTADFDRSTLKTLRDAARTRDVTTTNWHGGGGFTHLRVGPSMFVEMEGMILLADWATQGDLSRAMCAQLGVRYRPDGIFAGQRGRTRYVVLDGMVGQSTVASILDRLEESETVEVWATQVDDGAVEALRAARPGSRLEPIPDAVLDNYRRKSTTKSPFGGARKNEEGNA